MAPDQPLEGRQVTAAGLRHQFAVIIGYALPGLSHM